MRLPAAVVLLLLAGPALAHEGRYVGPVGDVSDEGRLRTDWPPPDVSGTGPTPPSGPTPGPGGGPLEVPKFDPNTLESWRFAWHMRENSVVEARAREFRRGFRPAGESLSSRVVEERILPTLRKSAADDHVWFVIPEAAILGLVRTGDETSLDLLRGTAANAAKERRHVQVEETGILALGFLDGKKPGNAPILLSIAGSPEARPRPRAWACVALGVLEQGHPTLDTLRMLEARLFDEEDGGEGWYQSGIAASAAFALGRVGTAEAAGILRRYLDAPPPLAKFRKEMGFDVRVPVLRCHAAAALGRAAGASRDGGASEDAFASLALILKRETGLPAQGAVIGAGFLGAGRSTVVSLKCVRLLVPLLETVTTESQVRRFAALALARIAAQGPAEARDAAFEAVLAAAAAARPTRSWAALAAGIAGEGRTSEERATLARSVRKLWDAPLVPRVRPVEDRGGCLVAMGLLRDVSARPLLTTLLADRGEDSDLRGYAATALGLLGDPAAVPVLCEVLRDRVNRRWLRPVVVALGLLGDSDAVSSIGEEMRNPKASRYVLGGCAQALGFLRDGRAVEPLLAVVADETYPDLTRAMALHALGRMAAGSRANPFADLAEDAPYRAYTDALGELWQIL